MRLVSSAPTPPEAVPAGDARLRVLLEGSVDNLLSTWDARVALFPFSSRLDGFSIRSDYAHPIAIRYTINSLLGLVEAARSGGLGVSESEVALMSESFFARAERIVLPADHGLATVLLCALGADHQLLRKHVQTLGALLVEPRGSRLNMQDLAWILWGASAAARNRAIGAEGVASRALRSICAELVHQRTGLPRHTAARYRRHLVSFGSLVYFLRGLHEAADALGDGGAHRLFEQGVARALALQGPNGEWPWMIDNRTGGIVDPYPVFAVHQDSMAMLFLHPAVDDGVRGAAAAAERSLAWIFGKNELGIRMFGDRPFFAYRSIERSERAARLCRYGRSLVARTKTGSDWRTARHVRLNDECRSYHLGWILYVWANRPGLDTRPT